MNPTADTIRPTASEFAALRARNADLEAEVGCLRRQLGLERIASRQQALMTRWGFTPREADFALALHAARHRTLSRDALMDVLYQQSADEPEPKILDVFACKMRAKAGKPFLETIWGRGYRLGEAASAEVAAILGDAP